MQKQSEQVTSPRGSPGSNSANQLHTKMIDRIFHLSSQIEPLRKENFELKNTILASATYMEEQRQRLAGLLKSDYGAFNSLADVATIITCLGQQFELMQQQLIRQSLQIDSQVLLIQQLKVEKSENYAKIRADCEACRLDLQEEVKRLRNLQEKQDAQLQNLRTLLEQEKNKTLNFDEQLSNRLKGIREELELYKQLLKQSKDKEHEIASIFEVALSREKEECKKQILEKQEQFDYNTGQLKLINQHRIEKLMKENELRHNELSKWNHRLSKDLDLLRTRLQQEVSRNEQNESQIQTFQQQIKTNQIIIETQRSELQQKGLVLHQAQSILAQLQKAKALENERKSSHMLEEHQLQPENRFDQLSEQQGEKQFEQGINLGIEPRVEPNWKAQNTKELDFQPSKQRTQESHAFELVSSQDVSTSLLEPTPRSFIMKRLRKKRFSRVRLRSDESRVLQKISRTFDRSPLLNSIGSHIGGGANYNASGRVELNEANTLDQSLRRTRRDFLQQSDGSRGKRRTHQKQVEEQYLNEVGIQTDTMEWELVILKERKYQTESSPKGQSRFSSPKNPNFQSHQKTKFEGAILPNTSDDQSTDAITNLRSQLSHLKTQLDRKNTHLAEVQEAARAMELNLKENIRVMQQQLEKSQQESQQLLKSIEKQHEQKRKNAEIRNHMQSYIQRNEEMQKQLIRAAEIIRYFNKELEHYKEAYNFFKPNSSKNRKRLPSLAKNGQIPVALRKKRSLSKLSDESQILISNLYEVSAKRCFN